jgi:hypothetical protein
MIRTSLSAINHVAKKFVFGHKYGRMFGIQSVSRFEGTKGVIRIPLSKKNRQHNGQKKKYKMTNTDIQNIHIKLKIK